jgi:3-deoxy-D-manno-octulosonate 8-phosphate phosphatase (KDO 8-P phosphatase)
MLKLVILDVDGVLTDGKKYYDRDGAVRLKTFCDKDWTAIKRFKALGIKVIFLTGDTFNVTIAENRNIDVIVNRQNGTHRDKSDYLHEICQEYNVDAKEIVFAGDDIFDYHLMELVGKAYCPTDSPLEIKSVAIPIAKGGENFVMHMFDHLEMMGEIVVGNFSDHLAKVYELDLLEKF